VLHVAGAQVFSRYEFGVRLARFHGLDPGPLIPARSRESGLHRPLDCTLDCSRARALLRTPLPGVDEVLGRLATDDGRDRWSPSIACD
jgi:dTDP-4-dehydrorhamnose reductase